MNSISLYDVAKVIKKTSRSEHTVEWHSLFSCERRFCYTTSDWCRSYKSLRPIYL